MKITSGILSAIAFVCALTLVPPPALACNGNGNCVNAPGQLKGAPGPIAGAGSDSRNWLRCLLAG